MGGIHFKGLDSLRFLAAFFVVLDHIPLNQESVQLPHPSYGALFFRGSFAVCFFFVLSGFLITYLLLDEARRTGGIRVGSFYLRRICRIWPLYFAVILLGLLVYNGLLPRLGIAHPVEYRLPLALLLYGALLPNLMNSLYVVGGLLNPTWSIGVEEQFYLLWAPAVKRWRTRLPRVCLAVFGVSFAVFCLAHADVFGRLEWKRFAEQLKFHYMAVGALCAWALHHHRERLLRLPIFARPAVQTVLAVLLLDLYLTAFIPWGWLGEELAQLVLYAWLILNTAANPRQAVPVANPLFERLGRISYGIYMLHMFAIYAVSELFLKTTWWRGRPVLYCLAYYALACGGTWLLSHLSYRWFELPFLRLKDRRYTVVPTSGIGSSPIQTRSSVEERPPPPPGARGSRHDPSSGSAKPS